MAHQSPIVPIGKQRSEPISWPSEGKTSSSAPAEKAKEAYRISVSAAERTFNDVQQKLSRTTTSLTRSLRSFATERPLHLVGIVASVSLVAGVALRIWRSKHDA
jgi:ElaB/YqjD/DUF883 family membrane-anchored ribosome-binding protein